MSLSLSNILAISSYCSMPKVSHILLYASKVGSHKRGCMGGQSANAALAMLLITATAI